MPVQLFANNAYSTLASAAADVDTTLTLVTGQGARFPAPTGGDYFLLTLATIPTETAWEVVKVTARTGDVLTVVRAQESTTALAWGIGSKAELRITAETVDKFEAKVDRAGDTITGNIVMADNAKLTTKDYIEFHDVAGGVVDKWKMALSNTQLNISWEAWDGSSSVVNMGFKDDGGVDFYNNVGVDGNLNVVSQVAFGAQVRIQDPNGPTLSFWDDVDTDRWAIQMDTASTNDLAFKGNGTTQMTLKADGTVEGLFNSSGTHNAAGKFEVVAALPGTPDANTIYFVTG